MDPTRATKNEQFCEPTRPNQTRGRTPTHVNSSFHVRFLSLMSNYVATFCFKMQNIQSCANNVNTFKNRYNRFWVYQKFIYDYRSTLTGTGNRSFVDNINDTIFSFTILLLHKSDGHRSLGPRLFLQLCFASFIQKDAAEI